MAKMTLKVHSLAMIFLLGAAPCLAVPAGPASTAAPDASAATETAVTLSTTIQQLVDRLDSPSYAEREKAMLEVAALDEKALPLIRRLAAKADAERAWRLLTAEMMIRWQIAPEAYAEIVPLLTDYDSLSWVERQHRLREVSASGRKLAIPTLMAALRAEKDDRVKRTIVRVLASRNMWPDGMSALREANVPGVDLNSLLDPRVLISIGNAFLSKGEYDRALREYERAIELAPNEPVVLYNIGCIYALRGKPDQAFDYLTRSVKAGYTDEEWLQRDPDLKSLHDDPRFKELVDMIAQIKRPGAGTEDLQPPELPPAPADEP